MRLGTRTKERNLELRQAGLDRLARIVTVRESHAVGKERDRAAVLAEQADDFKEVSVKGRFTTG